MAGPRYLWMYGLWERIDNEIYKQKRTKKDVAKQCGFDRKTLYGYHNISLVYFARLCSVLHVSADYLLFGKKRGRGGD